MSQVITSQEAEQAIQVVVKRAQAYREFRQLCLTDPSAAIKKAIGKDIPEGFTLRFVENKGADLTVVLPDPIDVSSELSDADLEQVAGGKATGPEGPSPKCGGSCALSNIPGDFFK